MGMSETKGLVAETILLIKFLLGRGGDSNVQKHYLMPNHMAHRMTVLRGVGEGTSGTSWDIPDVGL